MPLRKGIYKNKFTATASATPSPESKTTWNYSLVNPATSSSRLAVNGQTPSTISTPQLEELPKKYMIREWTSTVIMEGENTDEKILDRFRDCEDDDKDAVIDLDNYTYIPIQMGVVSGAGLTDLDIKSAVGGTGKAGSALFSSSTAQSIKKDEEAAKEAQEAKDSLAADVATTTEKAKESENDVEGDVNME